MKQGREGRAGKRRGALDLPKGRGHGGRLGLLLVGLLILWAGDTIGSGAQRPSVSTLTSLSFDQKLNTQVDLGLSFRDETGHAIQLGQYFGRKPVILDLGYYQCPMLCSLVLNGLIESLQGVQGSVGADFEVVCVSISPTETPGLAAAKKRNYVKRYARAGAGEGWHFLTGEPKAIQALAQAVGFHYVYDPVARQYAHPSGLVILTPEGKVAKYFFGVSYAPHELQTALREAQAQQVGSPVRQLLILCCSFLPLVGKYSGQILLLVRIAGVLVLVSLIGFVLWCAVRKAPAPVPVGAREPGRKGP